MTRRRFAKDELPVAEEVLRSYPWWLGGRLPTRLGIRLMEFILPPTWWAVRDARRVAKGLPL